MNTVEAILFDLDNTLLGTSKLEVVRRTRDMEKLEQLLPKMKLFKKILPTLESIKNKNIPLGIVTNSPRWYAERLLAYFNIEDYFSVIITYDEVKPYGEKPNARGINLACEHLKIQNKSNVFYVGDQKIDIEASYAAGVTPLAPTWANIKMSQMPACIVSTDEFIKQLSTPSNLILLAEAAAKNDNLTAIKGKKFYFVPLNMDGEVIMPERKNIELITFGRYFTNKSEITSTLRATHKLSMEISRKDTQENQESYSVPEYWTDLLFFVLKRLSDFLYENENYFDDFDIVTVIPSKQHKPARLEQLLTRIEAKGELPYRFIPDMFYFADDAKSLKTLGGAAKRNEEVDKSLIFKEQYSNVIAGKKVIVIDDVITTGATFKKAKRLLEDQNIERFLGVSIAKTVHSIGPQKICPACGRPMRIIEGKINIPFWGCSGFHENIEQCTNIENLEVKDCPRCGDKLIKMSGKYGMFLSHDRKVYGSKCKHSESMRG